MGSLTTETRRHGEEEIPDLFRSEIRSLIRTGLSWQTAAAAEGRLFPLPATFPRVALFLKGDSVKGTSGIRPSLAGEALIQYERMFSEQAIYERDQ